MTLAASPPLIAVEDLEIWFKDQGSIRRAVSGVSFQLEAGQCVALVGESGSGKSVSARSLIGLNGPTARVRAGSLRLAGRDLLALNERQWRGLRGREIGYILQDALVSLDPLRTIGQEVEEAIRTTDRARGPAVKPHALELLQQARLPDPLLRYDEYPAQLSGGLRQRALIASAIAGQPKVLIADEPTTALDVSVQQEILELFADLKRQGIALILISHDLGVVSRLADHVLVMRRGEVLECGPARQVLQAPAHAYTRQLLAAIPRLDDPAPPAPRQADAEPVLRADHLSKNYGTRQAVRDVSIRLYRGRTLGLVGESGSGKTTLARIVAGLERQDDGGIAAPLVNTAGQARPVQYVHQDPLSAFDPRYTVERVIGEALWLRHGNEPGATRRQRVTHWLSKVGLDPALATRRPLTLSGGQRQRVAIARALATEPQIVVLDEPVSALDVSVQKQILALITTLQAETGIAILFISHDLGVIRQVSHDVIVLRHGQIREQGEARRVLEHPTDHYTRQLIAAVPTLGSRQLEAAA